MHEPKVIVLLVSPLEGFFAIDGVIGPEVLKSYKTLITKGMKILFVSDLALEDAGRVVSSLEIPAPVMNLKEGVHNPEAGAWQIPQTNELSLTAIIGKLRESGDIIIPIGIGSLPKHGWLNDVELAALLPGSKKPGSAVSTYQCKADGLAAWCEWAETMMRRIRIILNKSEMRQWNGS